MFVMYTVCLLWHWWNNNNNDDDDNNNTFWHLNYGKIAIKGGVSLIKVVSVQKIQIVIHKIERRLIVTASWKC